MVDDMKIAFLADSFLHDPSTGVNGTQVQMFNLASAFVRRGLDVHYLAMTSASQPPDSMNGIRLHWAAGAKGGWLAELRRYRRILDRIRPDVVYQRGRSHLTYLAADWAGKNGARFVWGTNGEDSSEFWKKMIRLRRSSRPLWKKMALAPSHLIQDWMIHQGIRRAHRVVNQTEHQKARLRANFGKEGLVLPSYFLPPDEDPGATRERLVLWLANLNPSKQPDAFVELARQCRALPDWRFRLAGGTSDRAFWNDLARRAEGIDTLEMIGAVPFAETSRHFARAALFVNTSRPDAEGLPNTFIQSWLHGVPVLSLHHDPNGWIAKHGLGCCAHGDSAVFTDQARMLLDGRTDLTRMGDACRAFARQTFAAADTIDAYLDLFREL